MLSMTPALNTGLESTKRFFANAVKSKGVAICVHGLNAKPSKMNAIVEMLQKNDIDVLRVSLFGHDGSTDIKTVSLEHWLNECNRSISNANMRASEFSVPLYAVGYSLGALLMAKTLADSPSIKCQKMILFAPAISLRLFVRVFGWAVRFLPKTYMIKSLVSIEYAANRAVSVAAFLAVFQLYGGIQEILPKLKIINTLIVIDQKDELINAKKIVQILPEWKILRLNNRESKFRGKRHHLIMDAETVGRAQWDRIEQEIGRFLDAKD